MQLVVKKGKNHEDGEEEIAVAFFAFPYPHSALHFKRNGTLHS